MRDVKHFTDLDGVRGLLALGVVALHFGIDAVARRFGHPGILLELSVDFFFVLSGFVLTRSLDTRPISAGTFVVKRAWRLLPVYYVTELAMIAVALLSDGRGLFLYGDTGARLMIADLTLTTPLIRDEPINVPAWSAQWELVLPIAAVLILPRIRWSQGWATGAVLVACVGLSFTSAAVAYGAHLYALRAALGLLAGAALYPTWKASPARAPHIYPLLAAMLALMAVALKWPLLAALFPWIAVAAVWSGTQDLTALSSAVPNFLGRISYTLYMSHVPVLAAVALVAGTSPAAKLGALVAAFGVAYLLTVTVERWGMSRQRRQFIDGQPVS